MVYIVIRYRKIVWLEKILSKQKMFLGHRWFVGSLNYDANKNV